MKKSKNYIISVVKDINIFIKLKNDMFGYIKQRRYMTMPMKQIKKREEQKKSKSTFILRDCNTLSSIFVYSYPTQDVGFSFFIFRTD